MARRDFSATRRCCKSLAVLAEPLKCVCLRRQITGLHGFVLFDERYTSLLEADLDGAEFLSRHPPREKPYDGLQFRADDADIRGVFCHF